MYLSCIYSVSVIFSLRSLGSYPIKKGIYPVKKGIYPDILLLFKYSDSSEYYSEFGWHGNFYIIEYQCKSYKKGDLSRKKGDLSQMVKE